MCTGIPCCLGNALALMKCRCQGGDRRMAGTKLVLSWVLASSQACYKAVCQTRAGRASAVAVVRGVAGNRRMTRRRSSLLGGVAAVRGSGRRRMVCNSAVAAQLIYSIIATAPGGCYSIVARRPLRQGARMQRSFLGPYALCGPG
jgi:hypothetical protein